MSLISIVSDAKIIYYVITSKNITNILPKAHSIHPTASWRFIISGQIYPQPDKAGHPLPPVKI